MPTILSGQIVTAADLNHLKPATYAANSTAALAGIVVDTDLTGATVTFDTETDNAVYVVNGSFGCDWNGAATAFILGKLSVDGAIQSHESQVQLSGGAAGDRLHGAQNWRGTLATAGPHTIKLVGSVGDVDQQLTTPHCTLIITIYES